MKNYLIVLVLVLSSSGAFAKDKASRKPASAWDSYTYTVTAPSKENCDRTCTDPRTGGKNFCEDRGPTNAMYAKDNPKGFYVSSTNCMWHDIDASGKKINPGEGDATCACDYNANP